MLKLQKCKFLFASFLLCLGLTACGEDGDVELLEVEADADDVESANRVLSEYDADAHRIENFDVLNTVTITWDGASATTDKSVKNVSIAVDGGSVTVRSSAEGIEYVLTGASDNGNIKFYSDHGFKLTLNGVNLTSQTSAVINNQGKKNCFVYLPGGTKSYLTDAEIYSDSDSVAGEDSKGCFFSEGQLIVCGTGEINVVGRRKHGIATDDYLVVNDDATVNVHTSIKDAIHTNDFVQFERGRITIVSSQADGIDCGGAMALLGGTIDIHTSAPTGKCIKCGGDVTMNDGTLLLNNSADAVWTSGTGDDADYSRSVCIKTKGSLHMNGGEVTAESSGLSCRGIFVMRDFNMNGGEINVATSGAAYQYDTVCDYTVATGVKVKGDMLVTGGLLTSNVSGSGSKSILVKGNYTQESGFVRGSSTGVTLGKTETIKKKPEETTTEDTDTETTATTETTYTAKASAKGIKVKGVMTVRGGRLYGYSATNEAIEVKNLIDISGGEVFAHSDSDDGLNAASHITISGGYVCGYTLGNDGIDANGNINVDGGVIFAVCKRKPEMALDANSEGGYKLYVNGGTLITVGPLESGAEMAQECFSAASYTYGMTYGVTVGSNSYVFTAPTSSQAGSGIVVSGAEKPVLLEDVTVTGGTTVFDGVAALVVNGNVTGGTEVVLESYVPEESGPGAGGGSGGGGGGSGEKPSHKPDSKPDSTSTTTATTESVPLLLSSF